MRYATATAFRRALETRLIDHSRSTGLPLLRLRRIVVFERLLARLMEAAPNRWVLKGGLALDYRLGSRARTTKDMDLGRHDDEAAATADLRAAQRVDLGDYFVFQIERTSHLDEAFEGAAVRYRVRAELAGKVFETVTLDIGFSPPGSFTPETLSTSDLLAFAEIEPLAVPALPLVQHVAEKVHAYTRAYGEEGAGSSRVKDLVDLVLIAATESVAAADLRQALEGTFVSRGTHALPLSLPLPPASWAVPYAKLAAEVGIDQNVMAGHQAAAHFLDPVLSRAAARTGYWEHTTKEWIAND